jgi:subtilisin family serine protease
MKEYIVSLNAGVDYDAFWSEIENASDTDSFVPGRAVEIINERPGSLRSCHYSLTDEEANTLRNDNRIFSVEIPPQLRDDIQIGHHAAQTAIFDKTGAITNPAIVNWGLYRNNSAINIMGTSSTITDTYDYVLDGNGVDVVIHDSGLQVDHPEFQNAVDATRVQQINWYTASGLTGTQSANHYRDFDGHGTHVAGITAGRTYGWAKNARIFSVKVGGLEGGGDSGNGISITDCFDVVKLWHRNKPVDPVTGHKRPTVVNMSWGYGSSFSGITGGNYRGASWAGSSRRTDYGMIGRPGDFRFGVRVGSVDSDMEELVAEGVIVCVAAGNYYQKIDVVGGLDYNNYFTNSFGNTYYHRGSSPMANNAIIVGNIGTSFLSGKEAKAPSSESGPRIDTYAAGTNIMSTCSTTNAFAGYVTNYPANTAFKIMNISGTSMASPQVAGVAALLLQVYPNATPVQIRNMIINDSATGLLYSTGLDTDYADTSSLKGSTNRTLKSRFNTATNGTTTGAASFINTVLR